MRHAADPPETLPLLALLERETPNLAPHRLRFEGPREDVAGARELRLSGQLRDVFRAMISGSWRTLAELSRMTGHPPASVSAQLRHLRKPRFGAFSIQKRHEGSGLWSYRLEIDASGRPRRGWDP